MTDIPALRALLEKATKGPWEVHRKQQGHWPYVVRDESGGFTVMDREGDRERARADAALIAAAVNALRALLSELEGLREAVEWYGEQARLARLIHSEGDAGRHALADDGGKRARAALTKG